MTTVNFCVSGYSLPEFLDRSKEMKSIESFKEPINILFSIISSNLSVVGDDHSVAKGVTVNIVYITPIRSRVCFVCFIYSLCGFLKLLS